MTIHSSCATLLDTFLAPKPKHQGNEVQQMWENENLPKGTEECPDCGSPLDQNGHGANCGGYHAPTCDTCLGGICDGSC